MENTGMTTGYKDGVFLFNSLQIYLLIGLPKADWKCQPVGYFVGPTQKQLFSELAKISSL